MAMITLPTTQKQGKAIGIVVVHPPGITNTTHHLKQTDIVPLARTALFQILHQMAAQTPKQQLPFTERARLRGILEKEVTTLTPKRLKKVVFMAIRSSPIFVDVSHSLLRVPENDVAVADEDIQREGNEDDEDEDDDGEEDSEGMMTMLMRTKPRTPKRRRPCFLSSSIVNTRAMNSWTIWSRKLESLSRDTWHISRTDARETCW